MSQSNNRQHRGDKGFTLIELIVGLAVAAIMLAIAVPSFTNFILNQRVKTTSFDIMSSLSYARSEAIKRNGTVTIAAVDDDWMAGWVLQDPDGNTLQSWDPPGRIDIDTDVTTVTFAPDGRANATVTFDVCDGDGSAAVPQRTVRLDLSGRPNLTQGGACG